MTENINKHVPSIEIDFGASALSPINVMIPRQEKLNLSEWEKKKMNCAADHIPLCVKWQIH